MNSRADIDAELARLEKRLPELIARHPEGEDVLRAFSAEAESLTRNLPAEHEAYANGRLNCMLASAGLIPGETEGEPCARSGTTTGPEDPDPPAGARK